MLNDKVYIEVNGRKLTVEMEGLTPLEVQSLAVEVGDRMADIARDSKVVDSSKLAILSALEYAAELRRLKSQQTTQRSIEDRKLEEMIVALQNALE